MSYDTHLTLIDYLRSVQPAGARDVFSEYTKHTPNGIAVSTTFYEHVAKGFGEEERVRVLAQFDIFSPYPDDAKRATDMLIAHFADTTEITGHTYNALGDVTLSNACILHIDETPLDVRAVYEERGIEKVTLRYLVTKERAV